MGSKDAKVDGHAQPAVTEISKNSRHEEPPACWGRGQPRNRRWAAPKRGERTRGSGPLALSGSGDRFAGTRSWRATHTDAAATAPVQRTSLAAAHSAQAQDLATAFCRVTSEGEVVKEKGEEPWRGGARGRWPGPPARS